MRVLITGGCGFVGANLVDYIAATRDWKVRVLDDESLGKRHHLGNFAGEFVKGDIRDDDALDRSLIDIDAVVHLAADTRVIDSIEDPTFNFDVNVAGSFKLLQAMRRKGIQRLVSASTGGAIIGRADGPVNEDMVACPLSPYGASKLAVEGYCNAFSASYGLSAASLRFSNVFGPRSFHKGSVVAVFLRNMLAGRPLTVFGDGSQVRDYVFVGDICAGIMAALETKATGPIQLGSGYPTVLSDLITAIGEITGRIPDVRFEPERAGEVHSTYCDIGKARSVLNFNPRSVLRESLAETWNWFVTQSSKQPASS